MGMSIRTNTGGNTSCRNLKRSSKKGDGNLQKLASGYQINRSADDASGLGITEKMRAQINALETITPGCQDGINLLNTADGYLDEVQNMLVRMTELSEKSANGILDDPVDRQALQEEMNHLGAEIDRIADTANFNGNKLFTPKEVIVHHTEPRTRTITSTETVDYSQYFSSPAPNYMELDPTNYPNIEDETQRMRGDTLKTIADKVRAYMEGHDPVLTTMDKGKIYYNKAGKVLIDAPMPLSKSEDDIKAELGEEYFSVDAFPDPETKEYKYTLPACSEHVDINYNKSNSISGSGVNAQVRTYEFLVSFMNKHLDSVEEQTERDCAAHGLIRPDNNAEIDEAIATAKENSIKGKTLYYNKNSENAVIATECPKPETDYYSANISYIPERKEPVETSYSYEVPHNKQSFVTSVEEEEYLYSWDEVTHPPITLQIGETSQKTDKLNIELYDLHTDKIFNEEIKTVLGYPKIKVFHPATEPSVSFGQISGDLGGVSGNIRYNPGHPAYESWEDDLEHPIYEIKNARRDNTETSAYENAITFDVSTQENAISNVTHAREVTDKISMIRASYGSMANRLEKTISNHENTIENMSAAKSRIKDTDMAKEMMEFTQNNVISQAAQSMLSQANTQPQNVLQLLQ